MSGFVGLSFFRKVVPETCSRIKTNARKAAIPSIIELSRGEILVIPVRKFEEIAELFHISL